MGDDAVMAPVIVLLGPPGSGKGTQSARLRDNQGFKTLVTGDLLREERTAGTAAGRRAAEYMDSGGLVPDELIVSLVDAAVAKLDGAPIAFDGFPRTAAQAKALEGVLDDQGRRLDAAVLIDVPDDVVVERLAHRDQGRTDDRPEIVRRRLRTYHDTADPLTAFYEERGLLRRVDGAQDADAVEAAIRAAIRPRSPG
jgi:adenylate kinase